MLRSNSILHLSLLSDAGLGFFFCDSHLFSCRAEVADAGLGFHPKDQAIRASHLRASRFCVEPDCTCLVMKDRVLVILGLHLFTVLQKGHGKQHSASCSVGCLTLCQAKHSAG